MIVAMGDNATLVLAITAEDVEVRKGERTDKLKKAN